MGVYGTDKWSLEIQHRIRSTVPQLYCHTFTTGLGLLELVDILPSAMYAGIPDYKYKAFRD
jgi:hypothetical protein